LDIVSIWEFGIDEERRWRIWKWRVAFAKEGVGKFRGGR
jgi:hypothetical protein